MTYRFLRHTPERPQFLSALQPDCDDVFDGPGRIRSDEIDGRLTDQAAGFVDFVERLRSTAVG
jgi:hypothetical protein